MNIIPLSEGSFTIDQGKEFIPFDTDSDRLSDRTRGSLLVEIQPFVVVTDDDVILLDAGLGFADDTGILQIHRNLVEAGLNPMDVTRVLMSHLHKDHAGGMSMYSDWSTRRPCGVVPHLIVLNPLLFWPTAIGWFFMKATG